jgi:mannose-6-phosphate isomerase
LADEVECFSPKPGDAFLLPAGTVHSLGGDVLVFEVQENSDVTFRLFDWNHKDPKTGQRRPLQVTKALASIDFSHRAAGPVTPVLESMMPAERERLFHCEHFVLWRIRGHSPFVVGATDVPRVLVCIEGAGHIEHDGATYAVGKGDVLLLPAAIGACGFQPHNAVNLLEIAIPEQFTTGIDEITGKNGSSN